MLFTMKNKNSKKLSDIEDAWFIYLEEKYRIIDAFLDWHGNVFTLKCEFI